MTAHPTPLTGVLRVSPTLRTDARGSFMESWNAKTFADVTGIQTTFVQDNESTSALGVVRGLHYQLPPFAQGKLVRVLSGAIHDVVVDLRRGSATFGNTFALVLDDKTPDQLWIPPGFAHGFMALENNTKVFYKATAFYNPESERAIRWDCEQLKINWPQPGTAPLLANKDTAAPGFMQADIPASWY